MTTFLYRDHNSASRPRNLIAGRPYRGRYQAVGGNMRALEIVVAIIVAVVVFFVLKILGLLLKVALIGAALGFVAGLAITFMFRQRT